MVRIGEGSAVVLSRRHLSGQGDECDNSYRVTTFYGSPPKQLISRT